MESHLRDIDLLEDKIIGKKILYIDDEYVNFLYFSELLTDSGVEIFRAFSFSQVEFWLTTKTEFSFVIISNNFLEQFGYDLVSLLKEHNSNLHVVVAIDELRINDIQSCVEAGCDLYLSRYIDSFNLIEALADLIPNPSKNPHK